MLDQSSNQLAQVNNSLTLIQELINSLPSIARDNPNYLSVVGETVGLAEREWTIETALYNKSLANFSKANRSSQDKKTFCKVIVRIVDRFLKLNNITWNDDQLFTLALDLMERCLTWNIADVVCFMKYVRQNPKNLKELRIYPNFSPVDLLRMTTFYYEAQAEVDERLREERLRTENTPVKMLTVVDDHGKVKGTDIVAQLSKKMEKGIKPQNAVEKHRLQKDLEREHVDAGKSSWLKEKEAKERYEKIARDTSKMFKQPEKPLNDK